MEEPISVWDPSVNVILNGGMFTTEKDFESFMKSLTPGETGTSAAIPTDKVPVPVPRPNGVGTKRTALPMAVQRPKRYRKTCKQEIDHLRAVAAELEKKLKEQNQIHNQDNSAADPFWKRVSNRLLAQRQKSVLENARLRDLIHRQMTALKALHRSLEKTPSLRVSELSSRTNPYAPTNALCVVCYSKKICFQMSRRKHLILVSPRSSIGACFATCRPCIALEWTLCSHRLAVPVQT